jgi:uncharacterized membrane protein
VLDHPSRSLPWAGLLLGFALGGFFDGILLHQVLLWHHLLSNVEAAQDMRVQIMADGVFHALMYVIAGVGLAKLWRARDAAHRAGAGDRLAGSALLGFGGWHILDAVLSHWITGIHRIKIDSPQPLAWDLAWLIAFGLLPALVGWRKLHTGTGTRGGGGSAAAALGIAALVSGPIAAWPPAGGTAPTLVVFAPGVSGGQAFTALGSIDAKVLWVDRSGGTWAVELDDPRAAFGLYRQGAMLVSSTGGSLGCFSWTGVQGQRQLGPRPFLL